MKAEIAWQDKAGSQWVRQQERTDAQLGPLGRAVMARVAPRPGERVLDVGCGAGQTALELAELVGDTGRVVGLDISEPMLERARERVAESGRSNVELVLGNAAHERFEEPFDLMFSRFGVMFFEQPAAAFAHLRGLLKPGGRMGFVCWQALERNPWAYVPLDAVRRLRPDHPLPEMFEPERPGPFAFADPALLCDLLERAGYDGVGVELNEQAMRFGGAGSLEEAVEFAMAIGPAARFVADAELGDDPRVPAALGEALRPFAGPEGVTMPARILIVTARRP